MIKKIICIIPLLLLTLLFTFANKTEGATLYTYENISDFPIGLESNITSYGDITFNETDNGWTIYNIYSGLYTIYLKPNRQSPVYYFMMLQQFYNFELNESYTYSYEIDFSFLPISVQWFSPTTNGTINSNAPIIENVMGFGGLRIFENTLASEGYVRLYVNLHKSDEINITGRSLNGILRYNKYIDYNEGYDIGYNEGYDIGYNTGYTNGVNDSTGDYQEGFNTGFEIGYNEGYNEGYSNGYYKGVNDSQAEGGFGLLLSQAFVGIGSILSIELLPNMPIGAFIAVPIVFGIIAFIIGRKKE